MAKYKKDIYKGVNHSPGQSLIDILIGLALIVLGISFAIILVFGGQSILIDRGNADEARFLSQEGIDAATLIIKNNWSGVADGNYGLTFSGGQWQFSSTSDSQSIFTRQINVQTVDSEQKEIKSKVSWSAAPERNLNVELVTRIADWSEVQATGGDTGGSGLSGDWHNPRTLGSVDLGPGNSATDLDVINKFVYMSAEASAAAKPDFFIVNATDGQHPVVVSSLNTGPGLNAVDVAGTYAYVGNKATNAQLQVIDVSNINNPTLIKSFQLQGVSGSGAVGRTVFYYSSKVYVGTKKATGPEFHVIDVSNPADPVELGSREMDADINAIYIKDTKAYVANSDDEELKILDVSDPANITEIGAFDALGDSEDGKSIDLVGNKLYLGRTVGGGHENHHEFHILDVTSPAVIQNLGSKDLAVDLNDLKVRDYLAFFATSDSNKEFQTWNISDPLNITLWSSFNFPQVATGLDFEDNLVYVSVRSNDALRIITSQ